jgi:hypothetical protein
MSSTATAPPVRARHPPAATSLPQRCRPWACRRNASHGSSSGSSAPSGLPGDGSAGSGACRACGFSNNGAALVAVFGAARSAPIRSRRARNSSIARIWSASDSSTTSPNGLPGPLDAGMHADGLFAVLVGNLAARPSITGTVADQPVGQAGPQRLRRILRGEHPVYLLVGQRIAEELRVKILCLGHHVQSGEQVGM